MRSPRSDSLPLSMCPKFLAPTCSSTSLTAHASDNYGDVLCAGARERAFQAYHQLRPKLSGRPSQGVGSLATPRRQNAPQHRLAAPHSALPCESFALRWRKGVQCKSPLKPSHKAHIPACIGKFTDFKNYTWFEGRPNRKQCRRFLS